MCLSPFPAADLTAIGTPNGVTFEISASHTYFDEGQYTSVTITVTNVGGAVAPSLSSTANVADAPLVAATNPRSNTTEAAVYPIPEFAAPAFTGWSPRSPTTIPRRIQRLHGHDRLGRWHRRSRPARSPSPAASARRST